MLFVQTSLYCVQRWDDTIHRNIQESHGFVAHAAAVAPVSEPSTKRCRVEEGDGEETQTQLVTVQTEEQTEEEVVWPEPLPRTAPPVRTVAALPAGVEDCLPQGCQCSMEVSQTSTATVEKLRWVIMLMNVLQ